LEKYTETGGGGLCSTILICKQNKTEDDGLSHL